MKKYTIVETSVHEVLRLLRKYDKTVPAIKNIDRIELGCQDIVADNFDDLLDDLEIKIEGKYE